MPYAITPKPKAYEMTGGVFYHAETNVRFEYSVIPDDAWWQWIRERGATHIVEVARNANFLGRSEYRGCIVKKTVAHVYVDEGPDNTVISETWKIKNHKVWK